MLGLLFAASAGAHAVAAEPQPARSTQDLYHWFTADDYPLGSIRRRAQGVVGFRLIIDSEGAVSGCTVESSSGDADLDQRTCDILRSRARYYPARDAAGRAVQGADTGRVTWRLPSDQRVPEPLALASTDVEGVIRLNGSQLACRTMVNGRPGGSTVLLMCELLVGSEGYDILQRSVPGAEFSAVLSIRLPGARTTRPASRDAPVYTAAANLSVRPDGSVSACTPLVSQARLPRGFERLYAPCALFPTGARQHFTADPSRPGVRGARVELRYYLRPRR